jgi:2-phospho-L-lactate guanylyltransferase (CobY/MobA/RfbA family)
VVLGDVAAAAPDEISQLVRAAPPRGVALAPSRDGGTSALLRRPADAFPARFGRQSAARHREAAAAAGVPLRVLDLPSLAIDLDRAEDVEWFVEHGSGGPRTRSLLGQLGWAPVRDGGED